MANYQNRKSTAPEPPPISQLWQNQWNNPSYPNSEADTHSISTHNDIMDDDEMHSMLTRNGALNPHTTNTQSIPTPNIAVHPNPRISISKRFRVPQPPLHATHAVLSPHGRDLVEEIAKNNPYRTKQKATKRKKRVIRPVNAAYNTESGGDDNGYKPTITRLNHHRKESRTLDAFLRHRTPESELKDRRILPSEMARNEHKEKEQLRTKLDQKLSNKFRPQKEELYDRGIYVTNPTQVNPEKAAWTQADTRRRNSRILKQKFAQRPPPNEVLNKGIIRHDDYSELFDALPQTQPPTPTFPPLTPENNNNSVNNNGYSNMKHIDRDGQRQIQIDRSPIRQSQRPKRVIYTNASSQQQPPLHRDEKLELKIKQRPTINEMKSRGIMYEDPQIPASLQARKRELHRRRASKTLVSPDTVDQCKNKEKEKKNMYKHSDIYKQFLLKRPKAEQLKQRHIIVSPRDHTDDQQNTKRKLGRHIKQRPSVELLQKKHIFMMPPVDEYKSTANSSNAPNQKPPPSANKKKKKVWISDGKVCKSKRRESITIHDFLLRRPAADKLVKQHILPSSPYQGGYAEIRNAFRGDFKQKAKIIDKLYSKPSRFDFNELERRGYLPAEYVQSNHDYETAKANYSRRRKQSRHDLEKMLLHRPPVGQLIDKAIIDPMAMKMDPSNYHERRESIKLDFRNDLNQKFQSRPEIDQVPFRYFLPKDDDDDDEEDEDDQPLLDENRLRLDVNRMIPNDSRETDDSHSPVDVHRYMQQNTQSRKRNHNQPSSSSSLHRDIPFSQIKGKSTSTSVSPNTDTLPRQNSNAPPPRSRGIKRKRVHSKSRESLVLEQFLPVRPEIQQLWDRNILPSLPPSPHKTPYKRSFENAASPERASLFPFAASASPDGINGMTLQSPPEYREIDNEEDIFSQNDTMSGIPQPRSQYQYPVPPEQPDPIDTNQSDNASNNKHKGSTPVTPQTAYIDKRKNRRQDSMAMLEVRLLDRAPRESLFELGILIMSPAPSPPPLSVIQQTTQSLPDPRYANIKHANKQKSASPDFGSIFRSESKDEESEREMKETGNNNHRGKRLEPTRKKRKLMNGKKPMGHKKKDSLVLSEFLGEDAADKLDEHLWARPSKMELINRGIVPTYSFTKAFSTPTKFARHRRNMTLELQARLEDKLKSRPMLNDLPRKLNVIQANISNLHENQKITDLEQYEISNLLNEMRVAHEQEMEEMKERYWNMLVEQKDKYKQLESLSTQNEITLRRKLELMTSQCQALSTELIERNTQMKEEQDAFNERLQRLKQEHREQVERQEKRLKLSHDAQRELRAEIQKQQETDNENLQQILQNDKKYIISQIQSNDEEDDDELVTLKNRIAKVEETYHADLQRERSMHRKFNEQSERVKQTLVDEINKMELQHQSKLQNLENQISELKEKNRTLERNKQVEMTQLTQKLASEIDKERNIATIMVEDLDEEKTRLAAEMEQLKQDYEEKLRQQREQIEQLRQVAQDAVFYGNKAVDKESELQKQLQEQQSQKKRNSVDRDDETVETVKLQQEQKRMQREMDEKSEIINELQSQLYDKEELQRKYKKLQQSKQKLEQYVLTLTRQMLDAFNNNLNDDIKQRLGLQTNDSSH